MKKTFEALGGDDSVVGNGGDDTLDGGTGNDVLYGGTGSDVYIFARGYGRETVNEYDADAGDSDTIEFESDVAPADVTLWRDSSSLFLGINCTNDTITVANWFVDTVYRVENVQFADGTVCLPLDDRFMLIFGAALFGIKFYTHNNKALVCGYSFSVKFLRMIVKAKKENLRL